ncbi:type II secretion system protein [Clostridium saudiense]|nr:type II secretion system protein [Clostridium saudiense]
MISMMELMEEKTPLTKNTSKKKGMTLVEVMAAMAILSILFVAISSLMINVVKSEIRADEKLEINNYIKSALTLFDVKSVDIDNYTSMRTINFDDLDDMQYKIKNIKNLTDNEGKFSIDIIAELQESGLYKVTAYMKNKNVEDTKIIIVSK